MGIWVRSGLAAVILVAIGLAGCAETDGVVVESKTGADPGWLQFRLVHRTAPVPPGDGAPAAAEASVDTLEGVWGKVGAEAAELAMSLTEVPTDPSVLEVLEPFSRLAPDEVDLLPVPVRLYVPMITCDRLRPSQGYFDPSVETVACEPAGEDREKLHLGHSLLDGSAVAVASGRPVPTDPTEYQIVLMLTDDGARRLNGLTADHIDRRLAILLTDRVVFAPVIAEPSGGSMVHIPGGFSRQEAEDLARIINTATKIPG